MKSRRVLFDSNKLVLIKQIGKGFLVLCVVALVLTALWHGTRIQALTLVSVSIEGGETIKHNEIETKVKKGLEGEYLGFIPRRFAWFYPQTGIIKDLKTISRIHNISLVRGSGTELRVTFVEYSPHALWCVLIEQSDCLFLDQAGYSFGQAPQLTGGSFLRFIKTGEKPALGVSFVDPDSMTNITVLVKLLAEPNWFVSHVELDQVNDIFLKLVDGGELKVLMTDSPASVVDNLLVLLASEEFSHLKPGNFQYIDLRFGNKVFVNEEEEEENAIPE